MSGNNQRRVPLLMSMSDSNPRYDWPTNPPSLREIPNFQSIPTQLSDLVRDASRRDTLQLSFAPNDCRALSGAKNCTEACLNPRSLFAQYNLRTCLLMASAALLVQNETYAVDMSDTATVETAKAFAVPNFTDFDAVWVINNVTHCITESCTSSNLGNCTKSVLDLDTVKIVAGNLGTVAIRLSSYCAWAEHEINADIAGPGLVLAYLLQLSLAVLFHLALKFTTTWTRRLFRLFCLAPAAASRIKRRTHPSKSHPDSENTRDHPRASRIQSNLAASRFAAATISSLVEFQEVQTYFVASIQIATLISFNPDNPNAGSVNSDSYGGALLNSVTITSLGIVSVSCILLVQRSLQRVGMHWWYPFVTMTVTYALALSIFAVQGELMPSVEGLWGRFDADSQLTSCGGNPSPMTYCRPPWAVNSIRDAGSVWAVCVAGGVVWLGLFVDQVASSLDGFRDDGGGVGKGFPEFLRRWVRGLKVFKGRVDGWRQTRLGGWVFRVYSILTSLAVFWMICGYITSLRPVVARVDIRNTTGWSFGQFIALAVWIPTLVKHIYYNIFGIEGGFEERIAANYTITRDDDPKKPATKAEGRRVPHAATYPLLNLDMEAHGRAEGREDTDSSRNSMGEGVQRTW